MNIDVKSLLTSSYIEPTFSINFYKVARPFAENIDQFTYKIIKTTRVSCWKIQENQLVKVKSSGIFFDSESYIIHWLFDLKVDTTLIEELQVYYWKGQNAAKGYTPLPPEIEEHCPVERVVQWSEPALFFHTFSEPLVAFTGKSEDFDSRAPHLLIVVGEAAEEIHFYEVPVEKKSLRSKTVFLLVVPESKTFVWWHGKRVANGAISQKKDGLIEKLCGWQEEWAGFEVENIHEGNEPSGFLKTLKGDASDYCYVNTSMECNSKLFYLNSITGSFLATEVEYPLRVAGQVAAFPFLQSHLYTASQPAFFLLDNNTDVWLWEGPRDSDSLLYDTELKLAKELSEQYIEEKSKLEGVNPTFRHIHALEEPLEFKNLFPFWKS